MALGRVAACPDVVHSDVAGFRMGAGQRVAVRPALRSSVLPREALQRCSGRGKYICETVAGHGLSPQSASSTCR